MLTKEARHYNHVTFISIAKHFMLHCKLIYMLSMLYVRLTIEVKVGIPESFKVGWHPKKITGSSHLKCCSGLNTMLTLFWGDPIRLHSLCARLPQGGGGGDKRISKGGLFWNNIKEESANF